MTRLAIISDAHGNLPALDAGLAEVERRGAFDAVIGGGDYCIGGAFPAECVARVRERGLACVRGNTDEWIVQAATDGRVPARDFPPEMAHNAVQQEADAWVARQLAPDAVEWLAALPLTWRTTGPSGQTLMFVHATPWNTHDPIRRLNPDTDKLRMLDAAGTDVLIYGHIHDPYVQRLGERVIACVGSIGAPMDGDTRGALLLAEDNGDGWRLEHVRVPYDQAAYLAALERSAQPGASEFARKLRTASFDA